MLDLKNIKYNMETLKKYIYAVSLFDILKTQTITEDFAFDYILNKDFQLTPEEESITINDVLLYQPHLNNSDLILKYISTPTNKKRKNSWNEFSNCK